MDWDRILVDRKAPGSEWAELIGGTQAQRFWLTVRAVGQGESTQLFAPFSLGDDSGSAAKAQAIVEAMKDRDKDLHEIAEALAQRVFDGADASFLVREMARAADQMGLGWLALDCIKAAMALAPDRLWYQDTHALVLAGMGDLEGALAAVEILRPVEPEQAQWIHAYVTALQKPLDYWYKATFEEGVADDSVATTRTLRECQEAAQEIRNGMAPLWMQIQHMPGLQWPENLSPPTGQEPASHNNFANAMLALRKEWTRYCTLLMALGMADLGAITTIGKPPEPLSILDTLYSVRFNNLLEIQAGRVPEIEDDLDEWALESKWGGAEMRSLTPHLATLWLEEVAAQLAVIRWAAGTVDSVFAEP